MQNKELKKNSEVLRKCAFCGGEATLEDEPIGKGKCLYSVLCENDCVVQGTYHTTAESAINAWNTRKPAEEVVARLEECSKSHFNYWDEFDDEYSFGSMNAYMNAIAIVKEGMG
jgi:hypothetical protein